MIRWIKTGKTINDDARIITYSGQGTTLTIESVKRPIPHANRSGTWDFTSFFLIDNDKLVKEYNVLAYAKNEAEAYWAAKEGK